MSELSAEQIASLRYAVEHRMRYRAGVRYKPALLVGGPLDGVPTRVDSSHQTGALIGWTTATDKNLVVSMYKLEPDGVWRFAGFDTDRERRDSEAVKIVIFHTPPYER